MKLKPGMLVWVKTKESSIPAIILGKERGKIYFSRCNYDRAARILRKTKKTLVNNLNSHIGQQATYPIKKSWGRQSCVNLNGDAFSMFSMEDENNLFYLFQGQGKINFIKQLSIEEMLTDDNKEIRLAALNKFTRIENNPTWTSAIRI